MYLPIDISTETDFADSVFKNEECEIVLVNLVRMQKSRNKFYWTYFTWEDYKNFCTHNVTDRERLVLTAFVKGGKPVSSTTADLDAGWLDLEDGNYSFSKKMIKMLGDEYWGDLNAWLREQDYNPLEELEPPKPVVPSIPKSLTLYTPKIRLSLLPRKRLPLPDSVEALVNKEPAQTNIPLPAEVPIYDIPPIFSKFKFGDFGNEGEVCALARIETVFFHEKVILFPIEAAVDNSTGCLCMIVLNKQRNYALIACTDSEKVLIVRPPTETELAHITDNPDNYAFKAGKELSNSENVFHWFAFKAKQAI